jgi:uncharacterized membrane protein (DUF373 family)
MAPAGATCLSPLILWFRAQVHKVATGAFAGGRSNTIRTTHTLLTGANCSPSRSAVGRYPGKPFAKRRTMKKINAVSIPVIFDNALKYIINILIIYIIVILVFSLGKTLYTIRFLLGGEQIGLNLSHAITDILSFLVMIELFRSFIEYFKSKRIRLHSMLDPAIIFILRELIVKLYTHAELANRTLVGFGVLLLCLGVVRSLALLFSPEDGFRPQ